MMTTPASPNSPDEHLNNENIHSAAPAIQEDAQQPQQEEEQLQQHRESPSKELQEEFLLENQNQRQSNPLIGRGKIFSVAGDRACSHACSHACSRARSRVGGVKEGCGTLRTATKERADELLPTEDAGTIWRQTTRVDDFWDGYNAVKTATNECRDELFPPKDDDEVSCHGRF